MSDVKAAFWWCSLPGQHPAGSNWLCCCSTAFSLQPSCWLAIYTGSLMMFSVRTDQQTCSKSHLRFFLMSSSNMQPRGFGLSLIPSAAKTVKAFSFGFGIGFHPWRWLCHNSVYFLFLTSQEASQKNFSRRVPLRPWRPVLVADLSPFAESSLLFSPLSSARARRAKTTEEIFIFHDCNLHKLRVEWILKPQMCSSSSSPPSSCLSPQ